MDGMKPTETHEGLPWRQAEPPFREPLTAELYEQLRSHAQRYLRRRFGRAAACLTWQPTALVNETLLRIIRRRRRYDSRGQFYALATTVMKRVLVDYIRSRLALKRAAHRVRVALDPELPDPLARDQNLELDMEGLLQAIERLAVLHPRRGDVARMRVLWGLTIQETAESLEVSRASVERDWRFARAWLKRELSTEQPHAP